MCLHMCVEVAVVGGTVCVFAVCSLCTVNWSLCFFFHCRALHVCCVHVILCMLHVWFVCVVPAYVICRVMFAEVCFVCLRCRLLPLLVVVWLCLPSCLFMCCAVCLCVVCVLCFVCAVAAHALLACLPAVCYAVEVCCELSS